MPEFKPTEATAMVFDNGHVIATTSGPVGSSFTGHECLILPLWRPIEQCPPEWKDGRDVWMYDSSTLRWIWGYWNMGYSRWVLPIENLGPLTHVMLPPPAPEEKGGAR